jgi:hypothetical protein
MMPERSPKSGYIQESVEKIPGGNRPFFGCSGNEGVEWWPKKYSRK